jgi:uncharacterized glyoxalase superfamily protein PhnB
MTTEGIEAVFLETHNWGKAARFFQFEETHFGPLMTSVRDQDGRLWGLQPPVKSGSQAPH